MNFSGLKMCTSTMINMIIPPSVQSLMMDSCSVTDKRLASFLGVNENLYRLKEFSLVSNRITDASVYQLMKNVTAECVLDLSDNFITVEGLLQLNRRKGTYYLEGNLIVGMPNQNLPRLPQVRASCFMIMELLNGNRCEAYIDDLYGQGTWARFKLCICHKKPLHIPPVLNISKITTC